MKSLNYLVDHVCNRYSKLLLIYLIYLIIKHETVTINPLRLIYMKKIQNRVTFEIHAEYHLTIQYCHLKLLTPETIKLLGSTKCKTNKDKNGENGLSFRNY